MGNTLVKYYRSLRNVVPSNVVAYAIKKREHPDSGVIDVLRKARLVGGVHAKSSTDTFVRQSKVMYNKSNIDVSGFYVYPYDSWVGRMVYRKKMMITSVTVDYTIVLNSDMHTLKKRLLNSESTNFIKREVDMIDVIKNLSSRIIRQFDKKRIDKRGQELTEYFHLMLDRNPQSLDEAIQKLLFYNALFWQSGHWQNGLGRLDMVLYPFYEKDIKANVLTRDSAKNLIKEMCLILGRDMKAKSRALIGDTGQYILLGGIDQEGHTIQNDLTEIFLEVFTELKVPDPKLILRVNKNTSDVVWRKSIDCILTGCGSPLIINENKVMKGMIEFGYDKKDVWNFGTSACWEPLIIGKSFDQNNPLLNIPVIDSLNRVLNQRTEYCCFDELMTVFKKMMKKQVLDNIRDVEFDCSPLYSLFYDDCIKRQKDFTEGGAVYAYHGVQIVSFPNLINALLNLKTYVFEQKLYTLDECARALKANFKGYDDMRKVLLNNPKKYGSTDKEVVDLTNELMQYISDVVATKTMNGKKTKVGFSSSHYLIVCKGVGASMDGRMAGTPFAVHISPVSHNIDLQEVLDFAGSLDYSGNKMNGNVVDFIVPKAYADAPEKLMTILKNAMTTGVYELQLNVLNASTLKDAKAHPDKYPSLVVRVWGFSAYFNDLPEEYKDNLIARAEAYAC